MAKHTRFIKNDQWKMLEPLLPTPKRNPEGGRPPADKRDVLEGILWVLRTGAQCQDLLDRYPSPSTCWRRLRLWEEQGVWIDVWRKFLSMVDEKGALDWQEAFIDGRFAPAKKGGPLLALPKGGKGTKWMVVVDSQGVPRLSNFRRLVVCYDRLITVYGGFFHLACLMIVLNRFSNDF